MPVRAHDCLVSGGYAQCDDGTSYVYGDGAAAGSDGSTVIRTPDGVYIGHHHPRGAQRYAPTPDPRLGDEAHPGCKTVNGRAVCG
ncbi:hypothetical protein [Immundisolibacter sp.]|uniref:hypothetical protein n=1 Tax=Immundisolibacter sp. TaxID=1934948 RepID=UPI00260D0F7C|nr:hypothetical protein [Immundisolibacter sp.]MDD3650739.1 hypothetical protein [Immundisolibacter sp.]